MSQQVPDDSESGGLALDRRRVLQGMAAAGAAGVAGCLGNGDDDDGEVDFGQATERVEVDLDELPDEPGGRLEFAVGRPNIDDYDMASSSLADDATVFNLVYDDLFVQNPQGEISLWMAQEYEVTEAQDVGPADYAEYMGEYEIVDAEGDFFPVLDIERPNLSLVDHPDDLAAYRAGELSEGDTYRTLTREEAPDAIADGVYGTKIEGRLHEGIEFHNGDECTAGDIIGSYDRYVGSSNEGQVFDSFLSVVAPDGEDGYTFELYAQTADAAADVNLPPFFVFPEEHADVPPGELEPREDGPVPIGTGPYQIEEFEEGSQLLLTRNENYWVENVGVENLPFDVPEGFPDGPLIDEINIRFVPEGGTRVASLQDGSIDVAYQLPAGDRTAFLEDEQYRVAAATATGFLFMQIPVESGPLAERGVRQAISALIPRQDIVDIVEEGWATPARVPIPEPAAGAGTTMSYDELEQQDWAYNVEPDIDAAEEFLDEAGVETPVSLVVETNADDEARQDKMQILVDELNQSELFDAVLEAPADIGDWTTQNLYAEDSRIDYAERNATAVIGLAAGFDPHSYAEGLHDPNNHNGCCNFFFPEGTFDFIDLLRSCRFQVDVTEDPDLRRERYDELWPQIVDAGANTMIDFSMETLVAGPDVVGYNGYPDRRAFLSYGLYAPYDEQIVYLDR